MKFSDSEVFKLHELVIRLDRIARDELLKPLGITYHEFLVLMAVREVPSGTQRDVALAIDASKSLLSQRVKALMDKRLLRQTANPASRREALLELTGRGAQVIESSYRTLLEASEEVFAPLGKERAVFARLLDRLLAEVRGRP